MYCTKTKITYQLSDFKNRNHMKIYFCHVKIFMCHEYNICQVKNLFVRTFFCLENLLHRRILGKSFVFS